METKDCLRKMEAIVRKDCEKRTFDYDANVILYLCTSVNGNIEAIFHVRRNTFNLMLYKVIYFPESNEFRLIVYKLEDVLSVDN